MSIGVPQRSAPTPATDPARAGQRWAARAEAVSKVYGSGETRVRALDVVDAGFVHGELTAVMGPSGSGKSTLMQCLSGLDRVSSGRVWIGDQELSGLGERALTELRRDRVGFVFQAFNLLPTLTARENITLPADLGGRAVEADWLDHVVDTLGLRERLAHRPGELSGGQQQRVACARALVGRPELVLADEPTGNLDSRAAGEVLGLLRRSVDDLGQTIALVTHDAAAAAHADRVLFLHDGRLVAELSSADAGEVLETMAGLEHAGAEPGGSGTPDLDGAPVVDAAAAEAARTARLLRAQLDAFIADVDALAAGTGDRRGAAL
ncbi:ABC transporter ATP-binding protein [Actinomycetospora chlora]|uniref:ABC transporter ATP-binding protein n=1 Tax=Actinomycetospora chlora TaxID=663608 RepID=A0ABP9CKN0_9PSEU